MIKEYTKKFEKKGYVHLPGFLDKNNCDELINELKKLIVEGHAKNDSQCPKSKAIHGAPAFDSLLEQLVPNFEEASGKKLIPTYAYARLYAPGEKLKNHRDRSACEISATVTLGFDGNVWPIYMSKEEKPKNPKPVEMGVGDAVLYRGCDLYHWRKKYKEGKWQAQVFLHYVDADGPNSEWIYDKRSSLAHKAANFLSDNIEIVSQGQAVVHHNAFSKETCQKIIQSIENVNGESATVGSGAEGVIDKKIRDVNKISTPINNGIGATLTGIGLNINQNYFKFDVKGSNQSEFLRYGIDGHYNTHIDTFFDLKDVKNLLSVRKLTVLLFLNDDFEGGKFFLSTGGDRYYPPQKAGTVVVFPSFFPHSVEPVTEGNRVSLVNWLNGPMFK